MRPATFALNVYQGDTYTWVFTLWKDRARTEPVDLTGTTPKAEIRDRAGGRLMLNIPLNVQLPNVIEAVLNREDSMKLDRHVGKWDLQLTLEGGAVATIVRGNVNVMPAITESAP